MLVIGKLCQFQLWKHCIKNMKMNFCGSRFKRNIVWIYLFLCCFLHFFWGSIYVVLFGLDLVLSLCLDFIPMQCRSLFSFLSHVVIFILNKHSDWLPKGTLAKITLCKQITLLFKSLGSVRLSFFVTVNVTTSISHKYCSFELYSSKNALINV